jgi:hypothetical protein
MFLRHDSWSRVVSAEIIRLDTYRMPLVEEEEEEPCDLATAVDVAIRDLGEILEYWGSEGARARAVECERMLRRVLRSGVLPPA